MGQSWEFSVKAKADKSWQEGGGRGISSEKLVL